MNNKQTFQNHLNSLAHKLQRLALHNQRIKLNKQPKQKNGVSSKSTNEDIIPHPSCVCSLGFAEGMRQFVLLNRVPAMECSLKLQNILQPPQQQKFQSEILFGKIFKKNIATQRLAQQRRENYKERQFIEWPNISQSQVFMVELPYKDKRLQISIEELLTLKQRKMIPERMISNFFTLLRQSGRINEKIEIASFVFLPTLLQGVNQNEQTEQTVIEAVRRNHEKASKCFKTSIVHKALTVIPFIVNDHYSMVIVKDVPRLLTKKDQKAVLVYCSSRYLANKNIMLAIKTFLQIEIGLIYGKRLKLSDKNIEYTQLILPKQVYSADSGLYMVLYCETLLANGGKELEEVKYNYFGNKLNLFPLNLIEQLRAITWNFYYKLTNARDTDKQAIIEEYFQQRKQCEAKAYLSDDYSTLDHRQIKKLQYLIHGKPCLSEREKYELSLEMHYNTSLNHYVDL